MIRYEINKIKNGGFKFNFKIEDKIIFSSSKYTQKTNCQKGIGSMRRNAINKDRFELKSTSNNKCFFIIKAGNGQIVSTSIYFNSEIEANNLIEKIINTASTTNIIDLSK